MNLQNDALFMEGCDNYVHDLLTFQSRMVRNVNPSFYWVLKRDAIDYRFLGREQMVNHYCKAGSFTTKVRIIYCCGYRVYRDLS